EISTLRAGVTSFLSAHGLCCAVGSGIAVAGRRLPTIERAGRRPIDFDQKRITFRDIARMRGPAVTTGTSRQATQQVDLGEELQVIPRSHRAGLQEVLMGIA